MGELQGSFQKLDDAKKLKHCFEPVYDELKDRLIEYV